MKKIAVNILVILVLCSFVAHADYFDVSARGLVKINSPLYVRGCVIYGSNGTCAPGITVNATLSNPAGVVSSATVVSQTPGIFEMNLTSPSSEGDLTIKVYASGNSSIVPQITLPTHIRSYSSASIALLSKAPFVNGSSFIVNVTFDAQPSSAPVMKVFGANGNLSTGWTATLLYATDVSRTYNITVPANADGKYVLVADEGAGTLVFLVKSTLFASSDVQGADGASKTVFVSSSTVKLVTKVRDANGAKSAAVTAYVTRPDSVVVVYPLTGSNGTYTVDYSDTGLSGYYSVRTFVSSDKPIETWSSFTIKSMDAKLDLVRDGVVELGGTSSFKTNSPVSFNVLVFDKSSDALIAAAVNSSAGFVNCGNITPVLFRNVVTGAIVPYTIANLTETLVTYQDQSVCRISFTAPATSGTYKIVANITLGNETVNSTLLGSGYLTVQNYALKITPVSAIGSGMDVLGTLASGENATFEVTARNLSLNGSGVNASLISNIIVTKISQQSGPEEYTNLNYNVTYGADATNPRITVALPDRTGPFYVEVQATVDGNVVRGSAFYFAKYVDGSIYGSGLKCSGSQALTLNAYDARTKQPVSNVTVNSIQSARDESGVSVAGNLTMASVTTDVNGFANVTINFTPTLTGLYYLTVGVTLNGKQDVISGGFDCRSLVFFPDARSDGGDFGVSPNGTLALNARNVRNIANGTAYTVPTGYLVISSLESVDPAKGMIKVTSPGTQFPLYDGSVAANLTPGFFSLLRWPNGYNNVRVQVCDNTTTPYTCETRVTTFKAVAFDAFATAVPTQAAPLGNVTYTIKVRSNVTGFKVSFGQLWNGFTSAPAATLTQLSDGWNSSLDNGYEMWNVTFQVPADTRKGGNSVSIDVTNYLGEKVRVESFINVIKNVVSVPYGESLIFTNSSVAADVTSTANVNAVNATYGINLTTLNANYNFRSKSNVVCGLVGFNVTRYNTQLNYGSLGLLLIDNGTAGVYDTLVISRNGQMATAYATNRSLAGAGFSNLYLRKVDNCSAEIVNTSSSKIGYGAGFGGVNRRAVEFVVPVIVTRDGQPRAGVTVDVAQMIIQNDLGGNLGGYGFSGFTTNFTRTPVVTDASGLAFLKANVPAAGSYGIILNISGTTTDTLEFNQVIPVQVI